MENYKNLYSISKTLRFELKPQGETLKNFKDSDILKLDKEKADRRREMQLLIDEKYKELLEKQLCSLKFEEKSLSSYDESDDKTDIIKKLKKQVKFKDIKFNAGNFIKDELDSENEIVKIYDKFSTYFTNFFEIRKHIFEGTDSGSVAFRLVDENLKIFQNNIKKIKKIKEHTQLYSDLKEELLKVDDILKFNNFLTQKSIDTYNEIIGGISKENGTKSQGINEMINLYMQKENKDKSKSNKIKIPRLNPLYKMILSENESSSFKFEVIENEEGLHQMIFSLLKTINFNDEINFIGNIFIKYDNLKEISQMITSNYNYINIKLEEIYDEKLDAKNKSTESYIKKREKKIKSEKYTIEQLNCILKKNEADIEQEELVKKLENNYLKFKDNYEKSKAQYFHLQNTETIKDLLDSLKDLQRYFALFEFVDEDYDPDYNFYSYVEEIHKVLGRNFNAVYNKSRNFLTKKKFKTEKFKINFNNPTLADGWSNTKETDYLTFILTKDNNYYLGVWNRNYKEINIKKLRDDIESISETYESGYKKLDYKYFSGANKMLPKLFFAKKYKEKLSKEFLDNYELGKHKKENLDLNFLHEYIDYMKKCLLNYDNGDFIYNEVFKYEFSDTKDFKSVDQFYREVERQSYKVSFKSINSDLVDNFVSEGKLFLFQIYSKDFSKHSKGNKNLNTIYWESVFNEENLKNPIFQLNGGAELYYREKSLERNITHKANESFDRKREEKGNKKSKFVYDIIKNKRYTEDKFFFHCPIKINFDSENISPSALNKKVNDDIDSFEHIIGIDRGERNLLYIVVINKKGEIIYQKDLNNVKDFDYYKLIENRSKDRDNQRKSWQTIENIKEIKEGYLSQVVDEVRKLQEKYKAIIVMENLNYGFKNSRTKVEKQVYQKFELALIRKLNYLIDKKNPSTYLNGTQLTNPITTLDSIGSQSGIVYYIPAWNTSKIDPTTGFVNLFNSKTGIGASNLEGMKNFISKIDDIKFNKEKDYFEFDIDYSKFGVLNDYKNKWTLNTYGKRIATKKIKNKWHSEELNLTEEFKKLFQGDLNINKDRILENKEASFYRKFISVFKLMIQLRNSKTGTDIDYMISPVVNKDGVNFDSRKATETLPKDADANGAYNIARKGLMLVDKIKSLKEGEKLDYKIDNKSYLEYIQKKGE